MAVNSQPLEIQAAKTTFTVGSADESRDTVVSASKPSIGIGATNIEGQNVAIKTKQASKGQDGKTATDQRGHAQPSGEWARYKDEMDRLTAAVKHAMATPEIEEDDTLHDADTKADAQTIKIAVNDSKSFRVPWDACRTWLRTRSFLREWYRKDHVALEAIENSMLIIRDERSSGVAPELWESVVRPGAEISFSVPCSQDTDRDRASEICYENIVKYKVSYFKRPKSGGRAEFVASDVYDEPVELEVVGEDRILPAIEEVKQIESADDVSSRIQDPTFPKSRTKAPQLLESDVVSKPSLKVNSPYLLNVLKSIIEYSAEPPAGDNQGLDAGIFKHPYKDLYLHLEDILKYKRSDCELRKRHSDHFNETADKHIDLLQTYLMFQPAVQYRQAKERARRKTPLTTFGTFWLLMKPGTDVYVREEDGSLNRYVLDSLTGGIGEEKKEDKDTKDNKNVKEDKENLKYTAHVWNLKLDERSIRQYVRYVEIQVFDDERMITDLPVFPVQYYDDSDGGEKYRTLVDRGRKYFEYSKGPCFLQYDGKGLRPGSRSYKKARVIVEHESRPWKVSSREEDVWEDLQHHVPVNPPPDSASLAYQKALKIYGHQSSYSSSSGPAVPIIGRTMRLARCECKDCEAAEISEEVYLKPKFSDYKEFIPSKVTGLTNHQYSILPSHMFAFMLNDHVYDLLDVTRLQEPSMAETAIDKLEMPTESKEMIKAITRTYTEQSGQFKADFISGKGDGQIMLLHGPPGTGKTLTAESVAEFTRRPLLSVAAADLGHYAEEIERKLLKWFRRANDWDAVVLIDEADIYLAQRGNDLHRNSVVSVFLRAFDYFKGILFLTTNRINQFDEAFKSRIHLCLGYDKLDDTTRAKIWRNLFQKLEDDHKGGGPEIRYGWDTKEYVDKSDDLKRLEWNGREIRNAFQTAVALAVYTCKHEPKTSDEPTIPVIKVEHLKQVVEMSSAFRRYMWAANQGMDDSDLAFKKGNRDDRTKNYLEK